MANLLLKHFGKRRVLLPVVHPVDAPTALASVQTAVDAGADGVFLINQGMDDARLLAFIPEVARRFPGLWIGINLLGTRPEDVPGKIRGLPVRGIWSDNAGIDEAASEQPAGERFRQGRGGWDGLYFGGVAFKYQRPVAQADLASAARAAVPHIDVITTSGAGTGIAADTTRIEAMRQGAGDHAMGLASGVTPENVASYLPLVDAYLVATGIESSFGVLDPERTRQLARCIRDF